MLCEMQFWRAFLEFNPLKRPVEAAFILSAAQNPLQLYITFNACLENLFWFIICKFFV